MSGVGGKEGRPVGLVGLGREWYEMRSGRKAGGMVRNLGFGPAVHTTIGKV